MRYHSRALLTFLLTFFRTDVTTGDFLRGSRRWQRYLVDMKLAKAARRAGGSPSPPPSTHEPTSASNSTAAFTAAASFAVC